MMADYVMNYAHKTILKRNDKESLKILNDDFFIFETIAHKNVNMLINRLEHA